VTTAVARADPQGPVARSAVARPGRAADFDAVAEQRQQTACVEQIVALVGALRHAGEGVNANGGRRRGAALLLNYVSGFPGDSWQQRWEAGPLEAAGGIEYRAVVAAAGGRPPTANRLWLLTSGLGALMALDVVRPSVEFVLSARCDQCWAHMLVWRGDPHADILERVSSTAQTRSQAARLLGRLVVLTGRPVAELTSGDLLAYRAAVLARRKQTVGLGHLWLCLADAGIVEGTLHQALRPGAKTVTELVDRYEIASTRVRNLLIANLTERSMSVDYSTLRSLVTDLCLLFWKQVEQLAPGIDTIHLPDDVATKWKETVRWRTDHTGRVVPRRGVMGTFMTVRGFYADLIQLAHEEPAAGRSGRAGPR
jgi:hypothetical protein